MPALVITCIMLVQLQQDRID